MGCYKLTYIFKKTSRGKLIYDSFATLGATTKPQFDAGATIDIKITDKTKYTFHGHQSGSKEVSLGDPKDFIKNTGSGNTTKEGSTTYYFNQPPSDIPKSETNGGGDIQNANGRTNYVFGRGNGKVYI